jgi:hypothetical protein
MARQVINIGKKNNDGSGDGVRSAFNKTNQNFLELYNLIGGEGLIGLRSLDDGIVYSANQLLMGSTTTGEVNPETGELVNQLSARTLVAGDGIAIDTSNNSEIIFRVTVPNLDYNPTLGTAFNAANNCIGNVPMPTAGLVETFNAAFPLHTTTLGQLVASVAYVDQEIIGINSVSKLADTDILDVANGQLLIYQDTWKNTSLPTGDVVISYLNNQLVSRIPTGTITNLMVNAAAGIEQRKLALSVAPNRTTNQYTVASDRGIASFNDDQFTNSNGWISIKPLYIGTTQIQIDRPSGQLDLSGIKLTAPLLSGTVAPVTVALPSLDEDGIVDAAETSFYSYIKDDATSRGVYINHLLDGRSITLYLKNANAGASKTVSIYASTGTTAHVACNISLVPGGVTTSSVVLDALGGTAILYISNINGVFIGK